MSPPAPGLRATAGEVVTDLATLEPVKAVRRQWPTVLGALLTLLMVIGVARQLLATGLHGLVHDLPVSPAFYLLFVVTYFVLPAADFVIFRHLWGLPAAGFVALLKKRIANDVVLGYSGETYFYAWARQRMRMVAAPFGAVKDVSILSAISGNAITLALMAAAVPLAAGLLTGPQFRTVIWSGGLVMGISIVILLFSRRVFSLPRRTLWWVFAAHSIRLLLTSFLTALSWHYAMPDVSIGMWLFLSAVRLLVSRLPLVATKDLLFAQIAAILIGQKDEIAQLIALCAALALLLHVVLVVAFGGYALLRKRRDRVV